MATKDRNSREDDEIKLSIKIEIYETEARVNSSGSGNIEESPVVVDIEACISQGDTITELKRLLESQDVLPSDSEKFDICVRLSQNSAKLTDTYVIPETTTGIYMTIRPRRETVLPQQTAQPSLFDSLLIMPTSRGVVNPSVFGPTGRQETQSSFFRDSGSFQQFISSQFMQNLISSPEVLRSIIDANPQMRELRERSPELNHILNDPQLLRESLEAMHNPGLMREMVNNTDRVMRNIDVVPGGYNALRRMYQSIQEPIWEAATSEVKTETISKTYDLQTNQSGPNISPIPSPWATAQPTVPSISSRSTNITQRTVAARQSPSSVPLVTQTVNIDIPKVAEPETISSTTISEPECTIPPSATSEVVKSQSEVSEVVKSQSEASEQVSEPNLEEGTDNNHPNTTPFPYPYLFQSVFPNSVGLRSLGGLGLPHGSHIRGVSSTLPRPESPNPVSESGADKDSTPKSSSEDLCKNKEKK